MLRSMLRTALVAAIAISPVTFATDKPTIILVHGAFADASSWNGFIGHLHKDGYTVVAAPNELRSVKTDAAEVAALVASFKTPVILVGHSMVAR